MLAPVLKSSIFAGFGAVASAGVDAEAHDCDPVLRVVASRSKDPNTQIGCVVVGPNHEIPVDRLQFFPEGDTGRRAGAAGAAGEVFVDRARRAQRHLQRGAHGEHFGMTETLFGEAKVVVRRV